jgi:hypothetical protein
MSLVNAKTALRAYLAANLTPEQVKEASGLVAKLCVVAVMEDRAKRPQPSELAMLADVFFNGRPAR